MIRYVWSWGLLAVLLGTGCGHRNNPTFEKVVSVRGTVVLANGSPVRGGRVTFHPKDPTKGEAIGMLNKNGRFELGTYKKDDGAMPGMYTVVIEPMVYDQRGNLRPDRSLPIPAKYRKAESSDLTVDVKEDSAEELKLVLR